MYFEPTNLSNVYNIVVGGAGSYNSTTGVAVAGGTSSFKRAGEIEIICTGGASAFAAYTVDGQATLSINGSTAAEVTAYVPRLIRQLSKMSVATDTAQQSERRLDSMLIAYGAGLDNYFAAFPAIPGAVLIEW